MDKYEASLRILGRTCLLAPDLVETFSEIEERTKNNKRYVYLMRTCTKHSISGIFFFIFFLFFFKFLIILFQFRAVLNLCCPYTSRDEMTTAIRNVVEMVENGEINEDQIDEKLLESQLFTHGCPEPEIIIRTSGVDRLSDFLLWQCNQNTLLKFVECYWPEFTVWRFVGVLLDYQRRVRKQDGDTEKLKTI